MPRKPKRPCSYPGCKELCEGSYCDEHKRKENRRYNKYVRSEVSKKSYGKTWRKIRAAYVNDHPLCEQCLLEGRYTPVQEVHHIIPINNGGTHDEDNLMSLCRSCHNKKHIDIGDRKVY